MPEFSPPALRPADGVRVPSGAFSGEFNRVDQAIRDHDSWKLERQQTFDEGDDDSWLAFCRGEWHEALRLHEAQRPQLEAVGREDAARGSVFHRVRVAEAPLTPYMQWELHALRIQHESGMPVRVVDGGAVGHYEKTGPLPEVVVLGGRVLYRVVYTDAGAVDGAVRFDDPRTVRGWEAFIAGLFHRGEDMTTYFDREVAHLAPPQPTTPR
ncbi:DUF6879 family protein [Streptomonospora litoralis]|uniref:DUF6879 domain-containing protein n=1 Tax=Streptomonospora litoralis TaxID=2498135 RepID=A0A4P6PY91_9ACTN|nr:DUF6879 family protein [Streptomonospora litoralis]QBI53083.1 hypothetical protein EKD16_06425 [Streptomonospora litoralis]